MEDCIDVIFRDPYELFWSTRVSMAVWSQENIYTILDCEVNMTRMSSMHTSQQSRHKTTPHWRCQYYSCVVHHSQTRVEAHTAVKNTDAGVVLFHTYLVSRTGHRRRVSGTQQRKLQEHDCEQRFGT